MKIKTVTKIFVACLFAVTLFPLCALCGERSSCPPEIQVEYKGFKVHRCLIAQESFLVDLILNTPSMADSERREMLGLLVTASREHRDQLKTILAEEKELKNQAGKPEQPHLVPAEFRGCYCPGYGLPPAITREEIVGLGQKGAETAKARLREILAMPTLDIDLRVIAIQELARIGQQSVAADLLALLDCEYPEIRLAAIRALAALEGQPVSAGLQALLIDPDATIRQAALDALQTADTQFYTRYGRYLDFITFDDVQVPLEEWKNIPLKPALALLLYNGWTKKKWRLCRQAWHGRRDIISFLVQELKSDAAGKRSYDLNDILPAVSCLMVEQAKPLLVQMYEDTQRPGYERRNIGLWLERMIRDPDMAVRFIVNKNGMAREMTIGMDFVPVPGGLFVMGCDKADGHCPEKARPAHKVMLSSFYMAVTEVTNHQWEQLMGISSPRAHARGQYPIEGISWFAAAEFANSLSLADGLWPCYQLDDCTGDKDSDYKCGKVRVLESCDGFRLPTEAQWEYACRGGGRDEQFCGGNTPGELAWYGEGVYETGPVGEKKSNGLGIYDMSGNVMEWCQDWYGPYLTRENLIVNPKGPKTGTERVLRGGSISSADRDIRSTAREDMEPDYYDYYFGIRLVKSM